MKDVVDDSILAAITLLDTYASLQHGVDKFYPKDEDPLVHQTPQGHGVPARSGISGHRML